MAGKKRDCEYIEELEVEIEHGLKDGWELVGGCSAYFDGDRTYFLQAITKYEEEEE
jgi:hypothetical protein